jgi:hypothetical protein
MISNSIFNVQDRAHAHPKDGIGLFVLPRGMLLWEHRIYLELPRHSRSTLVENDKKEE